MKRRDSATVLATLRTDPANLILGLQAIGDPALASHCMRAQFDLYERSAKTDGKVLSRLNQAVLHAILGPSSELAASCVLDDRLSSSELAAELSPVAFATLALEYASGSIADEAIPREQELAAVAVRSVWMRDLSGVGLALLASKLLFSRSVPSGLIGWIARITRRDGFCGMWDFYADCYPTANLLGTVNIYWGLSASGDPRSSQHLRDTETESTCTIDLSRRCREAIVRAQSWLMANEARFLLLPACRDAKEYGSRFKPLIELALLTYVLTRHHHQSVDAPWVAWAKSTAERLFPHIEWEGMMEMFRLHTSSTLGLAIYPFLMSATGRTSSFAAEAKSLLEDSFARAQERTPMREMDYQFTRYCMGIHIPPDEVSEQIARTILRMQFDPLLMDTDALYDLTHVIFYATRFGCMPWTPPGDRIDIWLGKTLNTIMLARFLMNDFDLGAELLLVHFYTGHHLNTFTRHCVEHLLAAQMPMGAFRGPSNASEDLDEFDANYHTTLVAMAALAEADLRLAVTRPRTSQRVGESILHAERS